MEGPFKRWRSGRLPCSVAGCVNVSNSHGMCSTHDRRRRDGEAMDAPVRAWAPVRNRMIDAACALAVADIDGADDAGILALAQALREVLAKFLNVQASRKWHARQPNPSTAAATSPF